MTVGVLMNNVKSTDQTLGPNIFAITRSIRWKPRKSGKHDVIVRKIWTSSLTYFHEISGHLLFSKWNFL